jgi:hypothetical protein
MRAYIFAFVSIVYLLNFTLGIYEIPDNLPIIGHIDEFAASALPTKPTKGAFDGFVGSRLKGFKFFSVPMMLLRSVTKPRALPTGRCGETGTA